MNRAWTSALLLCLSACNTEAEADPGSMSATSGAATSGGAGTSGSTGASAGQPVAGAAGSVPSGGSTSGTAGTAGAAPAGVGGSAGSAGSGGATSDAGSAGMPTGGAPSAAKPSPGCGKAGRPEGGAVTAPGDHIYAFPQKYDGTTPLPVLVALHAYNNPYTQLQDLTNGSKLESDYVRVFPKSAGDGWVLDTDRPRLNRIFEEVRSSYCIDESRVFVTGHSSGAQMAVQLLCAGEQRFKAAAPVAASKYCQKLDAIPVLYIQGKMDAQRGGGNGKDVVDLFAQSNACSTMTEPVAAIAGCESKFDHQPVTPGCVSYQGCAEPTLWCSHDDNGYNSTNGRMHGWPCFASEAMAWFFASLP